VTIDQLSYCLPDPSSKSGTNIPFINRSNSSFESVGVGMFKDSSFMSTLSLPPPVNYVASLPVYAISSVTNESTLPNLIFERELCASLHSFFLAILFRRGPGIHAIDFTCGVGYSIYRFRYAFVWGWGRLSSYSDDHLRPWEIYFTYPALSQTYKVGGVLLYPPMKYGHCSV